MRGFGEHKVDKVDMEELTAEGAWPCTMDGTLEFVATRVGRSVAETLTSGGGERRAGGRRIATKSSVTSKSSAVVVVLS